MVALLDVAVAGCAVGVPVTVAAGMWSKEVGTGLPLSAWFGWHPVLMTLGYSCLMTLGRWSYMVTSSEPDGFLSTLQGRRQLHRALMIAASVCVLFGYMAIFLAHLPGRQFFGYDFVKGEWKEWTRVLHVLVGYGLVVMTVLQAVMGLKKLQILQDGGPRIFTFHGDLGKGIIALSAVEVLIAVYFWGWGHGMKAMVAGLSLLCAVCGAALPRGLIAKSRSGSELNENEIRPITVGSQSA